MRSSTLKWLQASIAGVLLFLWAGTFAGCSSVGCPADPAGGRLYKNSRYGFQFFVPGDWVVTETNFTHSHYADIFLTITTRPPRQTVPPPIGARGDDYDPDSVSDQILADDVYVSVGYLDGPDGPTMRSDSVNTGLVSILATNRVPSSFEPSLSGLDLRFFKRGHWWNISAYLREPVSPENRLRVTLLLESFRFTDEPVSNAAWAESLAWNALPEQVRESGPWPVVDFTDDHPRFGPRSLVVEKSRSDYAVKFTVNGTGSWNYRVSSDGQVRPERITK